MEVCASVSRFAVLFLDTRVVDWLSAVLFFTLECLCGAMVQRTCSSGHAICKKLGVIPTYDQ